jgi:hypothetical protein
MAGAPLGRPRAPRRPSPPRLVGRPARRNCASQRRVGNVWCTPLKRLVKVRPPPPPGLGTRPGALGRGSAPAPVPSAAAPCGGAPTPPPLPSGGCSRVGGGAGAVLMRADCTKSSPPVPSPPASTQVPQDQHTPPGAWRPTHPPTHPPGLSWGPTLWGPAPKLRSMWCGRRMPLFRLPHSATISWGSRGEGGRGGMGGGQGPKGAWGVLPAASQAHTHCTSRRHAGAAATMVGACCLAARWCCASSLPRSAPTPLPQPPPGSCRGGRCAAPHPLPPRAPASCILAAAACGRCHRVHPCAGLVRHPGGSVGQWARKPQKGAGPARRGAAGGTAAPRAACGRTHPGGAAAISLIPQA